MTAGYDLVLDGRYYLRELVESITLEDSLDEIAMRADVRLAVTPDLPAVEPGQRVEILGVPYGGADMVTLLAPGVVWEAEAESGIGARLSLCIYDLMIYLAKSEDEYLFPAGQTAAQRLKRYAADWSIPLGQVADTKIPLAKAVRRAQSIYAMIRADLAETATKNGNLYRPRMTPSGLELVPLGSNTTVWRLAAGESIETMTNKSSLEGSITQVKVLGNAGEETRSPVLAVVKGETSRYGTLQHVLRDPKITTTTAAKTAGQKLLAGVQRTITISAPDVNTIRAGDRVQLNSEDVYVVSVKHECGNPGRMVLSIADIEYIRRRLYAA